MRPRNRSLEPRKGPLQRRSRQTVADLLHAAAQVFEELGYSGATTNRIAERAGVSIGTLYQYFPGKDAMAVALLERHVGETLARLRGWVGHMVAERHGLRAALHDYVSGMLEMHASRPRLQHILLEEVRLPERVHQALLDAERRAARTVGGLLRLYPEVRHARVDHAGFLVVQTVESLTHRWAAHPGRAALSRTDLLEEVVRMLEAYLVTAPAGALPRSRAP